MTRFSFLLVAMLLVASGCKYSKEYQTITITGKFSLSVPPWVEKEEDLKPGADLQYANRYRNFYVIGERLPSAVPADSLGTEVTKYLNLLRSVTQKPLVTDSGAITVNGLPGVHVEFMGKMKEESIYYSEVLLQGKNGTYHLSLWTRGEDRKLRFKEDISRIINSFKEL